MPKLKEVPTVLRYQARVRTVRRLTHHGDRTKIINEDAIMLRRALRVA